MSLSEEKKFFHSEGWQLFFRTLSRVFLICAIFCIFYGAYFVAEQTFSNQPYNAQSHKKVTVIVTQNESDEKVAETLVSKKLIYTHISEYLCDHLCSCSFKCFRTVILTVCSRHYRDKYCWLRNLVAADIDI